MARRGGSISVRGMARGFRKANEGVGGRVPLHLVLKLSRPEKQMFPHSHKELMKIIEAYAEVGTGEEPSNLPKLTEELNAATDAHRMQQKSEKHVKPVNFHLLKYAGELAINVNILLCAFGCSAFVSCTAAST
ncbi:unnamed protein product [Chrysoparadoxa australica]